MSDSHCRSSTRPCFSLLGAVITPNGRSCYKARRSSSLAVVVPLPPEKQQQQKVVLQEKSMNLRWNQHTSTGGGRGGEVSSGGITSRRSGSSTSKGEGHGHRRQNEEQDFALCPLTGIAVPMTGRTVSGRRWTVVQEDDARLEAAAVRASPSPIPVGGNEMGGRTTATRNASHQVAALQQQQPRSRTVSCPGPRTGGAVLSSCYEQQSTTPCPTPSHHRIVDEEEEEEERRVRESTKSYDRATWRMYCRITTARKNRYYERQQSWPASSAGAAVVVDNNPNFDPVKLAMMRKNHHQNNKQVIPSMNMKMGGVGGGGGGTTTTSCYHHNESPPSNKFQESSHISHGLNDEEEEEEGVFELDMEI